MHLSVLGTDPEILRLLAAARDAGHSIHWLGDVRPEDAAAISQMGLGLIDRASEWELLLDRNSADAVLVGRGTTPAALRAEQLKRCGTEAVPLLVVHPVFDSVLPYYEVDMARRESGGLVRHYNPLMPHAILPELAQWLEAGHPTVGPIHQLSCERRLPDGSRPSVLAHLARDVELLAAVAGPIGRVTAIGPGRADTSFASLQIQMKTDSAASLRWSVRTVGRADESLELNLIGAHGSVALHIPSSSAIGEQATWQLAAISEEHDHEQEALPAAAPARVAIDELAAAVAAEDIAARTAHSTWEAATRAMEVVDAVELSLEKGRTIEVFQQQLTGRLAFRGTMAAIGCGLLVLGFLVMVVVTIFGGAEGQIGQKLVPFWAMALLALLGFFLLLQAMPLLVRPSRRDKPERDPRKS